jgi:hypothetical protein
MRASVLGMAIAVLLAGCGGGGTPVKLYKSEKFDQTAAFSRKIPLPSSIVCRSVKRALLSQGYVIDQTPGNKDSPLLAGTKSWQPEDEVAVTLRLQVTCVHEDEHSSTVFATAVEEAYKLQEITGSVSAGVSVFTVTMPSTSGRALMVVRRETIQDPEFYSRFYGLVEKYAATEPNADLPALAEDQTQTPAAPAQVSPAPASPPGRQRGGTLKPVRPASTPATVEPRDVTRQPY